MVKPYNNKSVHRVKKKKQKKPICSKMFHEIDVIESFAKFTGKHLCWSHFLINLRA